LNLFFHIVFFCRCTLDCTCYNNWSWKNSELFAWKPLTGLCPNLYIFVSCFCTCNFSCHTYFHRLSSWWSWTCVILFFFLLNWWTSLLEPLDCSLPSITCNIFSCNAL
jgi:hypothetical protein